MCLAVPGKILSVSGAGLERSGRVSFGGAVREVSLACVPEADCGDYVLAHAGIAISVVNESEARQVFSYLRQLDPVAVSRRGER